MSSYVSWNFVVKVRDGKLNEFKTLMNTMIEATKADEPGTSHYEWSFNQDETECHLYERYENSDAVMVHMKNFGSKFAKDFMTCIKPVSFTVYGNPTEDLKQALTDLRPAYYSQRGGFNR